MPLEFSFSGVKIVDLGGSTSMSWQTIIIHCVDVVHYSHYESAMKENTLMVINDKPFGILTYGLLYPNWTLVCTQLMSKWHLKDFIITPSITILMVENIIF